MSRLWVRVLLFLSSYFPLSLIFLMLYWDKNRVFAWAAIALGTSGVIGLVVYLQQASRLAPVPVKIESIQRRDSEAMSYIVTYVIPFLALPAEAQDKGIALLVFFITVAVIYVNSQMIHINPMLNCAGYHLSEITTPDGGDFYLLHKKRVKRGSEVLAVSLTHDIFFERIK